MSRTVNMCNNIILILIGTCMFYSVQEFLLFHFPTLHYRISMYKMDYTLYMMEMNVDPSRFPLWALETISKVMFNYAEHLLSSIWLNYRLRLKPGRGSPHHFSISVLNALTRRKKAVLSLKLALRTPLRHHNSPRCEISPLTILIFFCNFVIAHNKDCHFTIIWIHIS